MDKIPYEFEECISIQTPSFNGCEDFIVVYPGDNELPGHEIQLSEKIIVEGILICSRTHY